jgi:hypothetical protein
MHVDSKITSARAFVRSLNILLKFSRLYGFDHDRTTEQFNIAWDELRAAIPHSSSTGLLLGSADSQLLLDGVPLGSSAIERSFAQLLTAAGVGSILFTPKITQDELSRFVRGFPAGGAKPSDLAAQLKASLSGATGIRVNEIRFVAEDPAFSDVRSAAQLTARTLGVGSNDLKDWLTDPQKLLQLIAAAQGANSPSSGNAGNSGSSGNQGGADNEGGAGNSNGGGYSGEPLAEVIHEVPGAGVVLSGAETAIPPRPPSLKNSSAVKDASSAMVGSSTNVPAPHASPSILPSIVRSGTPVTQTVGEDDLLGILKVLTHLGSQVGDTPAPAGAPGFQQELTDMPARNQDLLRQALASFAAKAPAAKPDRNMLIQLAEHLAIRFALDRYERGEVKVNAVRQTLDRMNKEIDSLRNILGQHEDKMAKAGIQVESHADVLDRQFWASVPEKGKRSVLLSEDAWCIPPRNVRSYCKELESRGETSVASNILARYASCIHSPESEARRRAAMGMAELADLYAAETKALIAVIRLMGMQMSGERDPEIQSLVNAAFVRLSQEAASRHIYPAIQQSLISLEGVENQRPTAAQEIRPRIGVEERIPEFIEAAIRANRSSEDAPEGLAEVLRLIPHAAIAQILTRFNRAGQRAANDRLVMIAREIGPEAVTRLKESLRIGSAPDAAEATGLLSRLDPATVEQWLAGRIVDWPLAAQDRCIRVLAAAGAPERGALLLSIFGSLDPLAKTLALDEIGICGDATSAHGDLVPRLTQLAESESTEPGTDFLRLKAIEALGRLRAASASALLQRIAQQKNSWLRVSGGELRIAALQALAKIDSHAAETMLPHAALSDWQVSFPALDAVTDSQWYRQRRYQRLRIDPPLPATVTTSNESGKMEIKGLSLSGGMAACDRHILPGTLITIKINLGMRSIRMQALMRDVRTHGVGFEIVSMNLEDRSRLRRLLFGHLRPDAKPLSKAPPEQHSSLIPKKIIV